jgi:hypothetical protein
LGNERIYFDASGADGTIRPYLAKAEGAGVIGIPNLVLTRPDVSGSGGDAAGAVDQSGLNAPFSTARVTCGSRNHQLALVRR